MKADALNGGNVGKMSNEMTFGETGPVEPNPFAVHFLRMALGLWAEDLPDDTIQGVGKADALALAGEITGNTYGPEDFTAALADLDACRERLRAARRRSGG